MVSVIIPCKEIDSYTRECIAYCKRLKYNRVEIFLLPDNSEEAIEGVTVIATGPVSPGTKRNIGIKNSIGEFCAFIDSDAYPRSDWLTNALRYLEHPEVGGVGGPGLTPEGDGLTQKAGGFVLSSIMVGNLASRYKTRQSFESDDIHSCNFVTRKSILVAIGGWNEKYWPGEDTLLCLAIKKLGKKLLESSDVVVYHHRRSLFRPHLRQVSRFGQHRGFFAKRFPENSAKLTYFFPSFIILFFITGIFLSIFFPFLSYFLAISVVMYFALCLLAATLQVKNPKLVLLVWMGIIATHIVYGVFFLSGLIKRDLKR
jgi:cellulose synthase/poly-beta-1,6-N-acetylglucosamine synthase-like glycosyltransferase